MQVRTLLALGVAAATVACAAAENPTAPISSARPAQFFGPPPPPPLDTQMVSVSVEYDGTTYRTAAIYLINRTNTNAWLSFVSNDDVVATPNARLAYNTAAAQTIGQGSLTLISDPTKTLDLSTIKFDALLNPLALCDPDSDLTNRTCKPSAFQAGAGSGLIFVARRSAIAPPP